MIREALDELMRLLDPLAVRIANVVARAVITRVVDSGGLQVVQLEVLDGEVVDDAEVLQQPGMTAVPLEGSEAVALFVGGDRSHPLVVAVDNRGARPSGLGAGESAQYNATTGDVVHIRNDGQIRAGDPDSADKELALKSDVEAIVTAIEGAAVVAADGGATFKAAIVAALAAPIDIPVGTTKLRSE